MSGHPQGQGGRVPSQAQNQGYENYDQAQGYYYDDQNQGYYDPQAAYDGPANDGYYDERLVPPSLTSLPCPPPSPTPKAFYQALVPHPQRRSSRWSPRWSHCVRLFLSRCVHSPAVSMHASSYTFYPLHTRCRAPARIPGLHCISVCALIPDCSVIPVCFPTPVCT